MATPDSIHDGTVYEIPFTMELCMSEAHGFISVIALRQPCWSLLRRPLPLAPFPALPHLPSLGLLMPMGHQFTLQMPTTVTGRIHLVARVVSMVT